MPPRRTCVHFPKHKNLFWEWLCLILQMDALREGEPEFMSLRAPASAEQFEYEQNSNELKQSKICPASRPHEPQQVQQQPSAIFHCFSPAAE
jgi:hypothetical protein